MVNNYKVHNHVNEFSNVMKQDGYYDYEFWKQCNSDLHRLLLNLLDKINVKRSDKYVALSNLSIYYT